MISLFIQVYISYCKSVDNTNSIFGAPSWSCCLNDLSWGYVFWAPSEINIHTLEMPTNTGMGEACFGLLRIC